MTQISNRPAFRPSQQQTQPLDVVQKPAILSDSQIAAATGAAAAEKPAGALGAVLSAINQYVEAQAGAKPADAKGRGKRLDRKGFQAQKAAARKKSAEQAAGAAQAAGAQGPDGCALGGLTGIGSSRASASFEPPKAEIKIGPNDHVRLTAGKDGNVTVGIYGEDGSKQGLHFQKGADGSYTVRQSNDPDSDPRTWPPVPVKGELNEINIGSANAMGGPLRDGQVLADGELPENIQLTQPEWGMRGGSTGGPGSPFGGWGGGRPPGMPVLVQTGNSVPLVPWPYSPMVPKSS
jgi:hypothetical protein